MEKANGDVK